MASSGNSSDGAPAPQASNSTSASRDITMSCQLQNTASLTMRELQEITDNFSKERAIGEGAYGKVYRGTLDNGEEIAVKLLHNRIESDDGQFRHEFENLMRLEHHNIVRLVGYCYETQHKPMIYTGQTIFAEEISKALCFEYMQNGSLEKHLSEEHDGLDWHTRYKIIKGTCEGLQYLHEAFKEPIYHLDLKPDNILLDENMVPKLADFGLSRLFGGQQTMMTQSPLGTIGYMPMEYLFGNIISNKFDIFSLGVIMTKIIAGPNGHNRRAEMSHQEFLDQVNTNWRDRFQATWSSQKQLEAHCEQLHICTEIALSCMENDRHKRPNISDIIRQLNDTEATIDEALSWSGSSHLWMQKDLVKIKAFTESKVIPYTEVHNKFPVLVRVTSPPWRHAEEMPRAAVDVVVVVDDVYYFPMSRPIRKIIDKLSPNDRLSIVSFKDNVPHVMKLTFMSDQGRNIARGMVNKLTPGDSDSNMYASLLEGAKILREREVEEHNWRVGCIIVLSNSNDKGIIKQEISSEYPVHTFGSQYKHSPEDLKYIADMTCGTYSFVRGYDDFVEACQLFIANITKIVVMSAKITLKAHDGVLISSIESGRYCHHVSSDEQCGEIVINNLCAGERKSFIVYLTVTEGNKKLVTISGEYQCFNSIKQLPNMEVSVMRPRSTCPPEKLAIHTEVAAELVRIRLWKGLSALIELGRRVRVFDLEQLWDSVTFSKDGHATPEKVLSNLDKEMDEIKKSSSRHHNPKKSPYIMSWLSCHQWQRATSKGTFYDSDAFTLAHPSASGKHAGSDGEADDDGDRRNELGI